MKAVLLFLLLLLPTRAFAQALPDPAPDPHVPLRQVLSGSLLVQAGLHRPGDVLRLVDGWSFFSMDGFHTDPRLVGLDPGAGARWSIWIDGQPAGLDLLGVQDLNLLPLDVLEIDSVEVMRGPFVYRGHFIPDGLLHFHTKRPAAAGTRAAGSLWWGNTAGDPGPFRYMRDGLENVDQLGPDLAAAFGLQRRGAGILAAAAVRSHMPTQAAIRRRIQVFSNRGPVNRIGAGRVQASLDAAGGHRLDGQYTGGSHYFFLAPLGRELPVDVHYGAGSAFGHFPVRRQLTVHYRAGLAMNRLATPASQANRFPLDWRLDRLTGSMTLHRAARHSRGEVGVSVEHAVVTVPGGPALPALTSAALSARWDYVGAGTLHPGFGLHLATGADRPAASATFSVRWLPHVRHHATATMAWMERHPAAVHPLWYWAEKGHPLLDRLQVPYTVEGSLRNSRETLLRLAWQSLLPAGSSLTAQVTYRRLHQLAIEEQRLHYDAVDAAFGGPVRLHSGQSGQVVEAEAGATLAPWPWLRQHVFAGVRSAVAGDAAFTAAWATRPAFEARLVSVVTVAPTFSVGGLLVGRSSTTWAAYQEAPPASQGGYRARVPGFWTVDLTAVKGFWGQRLRGDLTVRNLLNRPYHYHPIGADAGLSLTVRLAVQLGRAPDQG